MLALRKLTNIFKQLLEYLLIKGRVMLINYPCPPPILYTWSDRLMYIGSLPSDPQFYTNNVCLLGLCLNSTATIELESESIQTSSFLLLPNTLHKVSYNKNDIVVWMLIEPAQADCEQIKNNMTQRQSSCYFDIDNFSHMRDTFLHIYNERLKARDASTLLCEQLDLACRTQYVDNVSDMRISKAMGIINAELMMNIPAKELANTVGLSNGRLQQLFKQHVKMSTRQYRLWRRLKHSIELSKNTHNLSEVALLSGFSDLAHFSHAFRGVFGKTASSFIGSASGAELLV